MATLRDLYLAELNDLYDAEQQLLRELPLMAARASSAELRELCDQHYRETQAHLDRLTHLFADREERPRSTTCQALRALIEGGHERCANIAAGTVLDAALIAQAQRVEHYEIATYASVRDYARALGDDNAARILHQTLEEERQAEAELSRIVRDMIHASAPMPATGAPADLLDPLEPARLPLRSSSMSTR